MMLFRLMLVCTLMLRANAMKRLFYGDDATYDPNGSKLDIANNLRYYAGCDPASLDGSVTRSSDDSTPTDDSDSDATPTHDSDSDGDYATATDDRDTDENSSRFRRGSESLTPDSVTPESFTPESLTPSRQDSVRSDGNNVILSVRPRKAKNASHSGPVEDKETETRCCKWLKRGGLCVVVGGVLCVIIYYIWEVLHPVEATESPVPTRGSIPPRGSFRKCIPCSNVPTTEPTQIPASDGADGASPASDGAHALKFWENTGAAPASDGADAAASITTEQECGEGMCLKVY